MAESKQPYTLLNGDTLEPSLLSPNTVDITITSPPYNVGMPYDSSNDIMSPKAYLAFSRRWLKNVYRWTKSTGRLCLNIALDKNKNGKSPVAAEITTLALEIGWKYHATILWMEGNISKGTAWGSWLSARAPHVIAPVEVILVLYKNEWRRDFQGTSTIDSEEFKKWVRGIWTFNGESAKRIGHEAPFPRELPRRCLRLFSFKEDVTLDPFSGSGTTVIEALAQERKAIGIEISQKYHDLAQRRIRRCTKKFPLD